MPNIFFQMRQSGAPWQYLCDHVRIKFKRLIHRVHRNQYALQDHNGMIFLLDWSSMVDSSILETGNWEKEQIALMTHVIETFALEENGVFIDVGAYWGLYGITASKLGVSEVHFVEPDPRNFSQLNAQLFLNDLTNKVHVHRFAISDKDGVVYFNRSETILDGNRGGTSISDGNNERTIEIECKKLDSLFELNGKVIVLKLDIEGFEAQALTGMKQLVKKNKVFAQIESFPERIEQTMKVANEIGLSHCKTVAVDHYFTNLEDSELARLLNSAFLVEEM